MENKHELRRLNNTDVFKLIKIIRKIGINNIKECFTLADIAKGNADVKKVGEEVLFNILGIAVEKLPEIDSLLFDFIGGISNMTEKEISELEPADTLNIIYDIVNKEEFNDFFTAALKLFSLKKKKVK